MTTSNVIPARRQTAPNAAKKSRSQGKRTLPGRLLLLAIIALIVLAYGLAYHGVVELRGQLGDVKGQIVAWERKNHNLERRIRYLKSEEYVESVARRELGLVKQGEVLVVLSKNGHRMRSR